MMHRRHPVLTIPSAVRPCVGNAVISARQRANVCYLCELVVAETLHDDVVAHGTSRGTHKAPDPRVHVIVLMLGGGRNDARHQRGTRIVAIIRHNSTQGQVPRPMH